MVLYIPAEYEGNLPDARGRRAFSCSFLVLDLVVRVRYSVQAPAGASALRIFS